MHEVDLEKHDPIDPFWIDKGELKGVKLNEAFVMGAEFMQFRGMLLSAGDKSIFTFMCMRKNVDRLIKLAQRYNRECKWTSMFSPGWAELEVSCKVKVKETQ